MIQKHRRVMLGISLVTIGMMISGCKQKSKKVDQDITTPTVEATIAVTATPSVTATIAPTLTTAPTPTDTVSWFNNQVNSIMSANSIYKDYMMDSYEFGDKFALIFQSPESKKEFCEYFCDIWVIGENDKTQVTENSYVDYQAFETGEIEGKPYFRYDLSYPSESDTVLLMADENQELQQIQLGGGLSSMDGKNLTVTHSTYDMCYMKDEGYSCGHTWKPYYDYLEGYELKEYGSREISEQDFMIYKGASNIKKKIESKYSKANLNLILKYLLWDNNLITVNVGVESLNDITYYYETYQINIDQTLTKKESGEGTYVGFMLNEKPYVKVLSYSNEDNSITVETVEWLCPWDDKDKNRLQELINEGKIEDNEDLWTWEFYLYEDENNTTTYQLADNVTVALRDEEMQLKEVDQNELANDLSDRVLSLTVIGNEVIEITEPYMP